MCNRVKVFIYGTLKRGKPLNEWTKNSEFIGPAWTTYARYSLYDIGYPALAEGGISRAVGELWAMPDEDFGQLVFMETRVGYSLKTIPILVDGEILPQYAFTFMMVGDWLQSCDKFQEDENECVEF